MGGRRVGLLLALVSCGSAATPPVRPPSRASAVSDSEAAEDALRQLEARVVEARVKSAEHLLPTVVGVREEDVEDNNATHPLLKGPHRAFLRALKKLRSQQPALWLVMATVMVDLQRQGNEQKNVGDVRNQVELGEDYHLAIVTTAALPWMTGTAVNPLLRAAHLAKAGKRVTLLVPWLHPLDQALVFPHKQRFESPAEQEAHIRHWLQQRAGLRADFKLAFYPGRYDAEKGSIMPLGDISRFIAPSEADVCVLEEPEHLTWYHNGPNWRHRFKLVVGVVHTNYLFYAREYFPNGGPLLAETLKAVNQVMCHAYCDKVIKLSDTLQPLPRATVCNVHGVRRDFLDIGRRCASRFFRFRRGAYFIGKVLWAKGHRLLLEYLTLQAERGEPRTHVDIFGSGDDLEEVRAEAAARELDVSFLGPTDHAGRTLHQYRVFVNPSQSEVLSTTTAEALAMGKFVILQRHPSNEFFFGFSNTLLFETAGEFLLQLRHALTHRPQPLSAEERRRLSWEGATERFLDAVTDSTLGNTLPSLSEHTTRWLHAGLQKGGLIGDAIRFATGAGPISRQSWLPKHLEENRDATCTEIVDRSVELSPPTAAAA